MLLAGAGRAPVSTRATSHERDVTMLAAALLLAVSPIALAGSAGQDSAREAAKPEPPWPHNQGRVFTTPSKQAWAIVQSRLKELGVPAIRTDHENQLSLTKWAGFGVERFSWLPKPDVGRQHEAERVRFEVFVSPFVEPARVYVGSLTQLRHAKGKVSESLLYNHRGLNLALLGELAKALGQDGFEIPPSRKERDELVASLLQGQADDCSQRIEACKVPSRQMQEPRRLPLSEFDVHYPQVAVDDRVQAPVVMELEVSEDGAVVGGRLKSSPRGHQLDAAAAGPTSLLVYSPLRVCGCPAEHISVFTVNYKIEHR
jgi:hypothetical protein